MRERRQVEERVVVVDQVPIFGFSQGARGGREPLQQRDEAAHSGNRNARGPQLGMLGESGQREVASIANSADTQPVRGDAVLLAQPAGGGCYVADGTPAERAVVEVVVRLSIARRAAHVERQNRDASGHEQLNQRIVLRPELRLGTSVEVDDGRNRAVPTAHWPVEEGRDV